MPLFSSSNRRTIDRGAAVWKILGTEPFLEDLKFSNYDNDIFWAPNDSIDPAESIKTERFLDYWFFSNSETMDLFGTL